MSLTDLGQHLVVESSIRAQEGQKDPNPNIGSVNMVEGKSYRGEKRKKTYKGSSSKSKTVENGCWECGKPGHLKKNCFVFKNKQKKTKGHASTRGDPPTKGDHFILNKQSSFDVCLMNTNISIVQDDPMSWFIDSGATRHVCGNKHLFKTLHKVVDGESLHGEQFFCQGPWKRASRTYVYFGKSLGVKRCILRSRN